MDPADTLLALLVCPKSRAPLRYFAEGQPGAAAGSVLAGPFLFCQVSRLAYPVHGGIPVMLVEEAEELTEDQSAELCAAP
ncbi:MAG TPA: Trm112 family protein [Kofleriaceae bacterium]|nr:Trm112 family protein [Kofleriaceae bacterium]